MSEEKCEFNMQGWCCCGLTTVPKEIGYADILCSDECNKNCYYKQLRTAKEENKNLTQQNKQMREALEKIIKTTPIACSEWFYSCDNRKLKCKYAQHCETVCIAKKMLQALKGVE